MAEQYENPWKGLAQQAHNKKLQLAPDAAREASKLAADVAASLKEVKGYTFLLNMHKFSINGKLGSLVDLGKRFNEQGDKFGVVVGKYIEMVDAMGDCFIRADVSYKAAEADSVSAFNQLKKDAAAKTGSLYLPKHNTLDAPVWTEKTLSEHDANAKDMDPGTLPKVSGQHYPKSVDVEYPPHDGKWFFDVGNDLDIEKPADRSLIWTGMAKFVDADFDYLVKRLDKMEKEESWTGEAAGAAIQAAKRFKAQSEDFTADLRTMAGTLVYVSGVLRSFSTYLPKEWNDDWRGKPKEDEIITKGNAGFTDWYLRGMSQSSTHIPLLQDPTVKPPVATDRPSNNNNGGGGGSRNGGGGGTGSGGGGANQTRPKLGEQRTPNLPDRDPRNNPSNQDPNQQNPNQQNPNQQNPNQQNPNQSSNSNSNGQQGLQQLTSAMQQGLQGLSQTASQATQKQQQSDLADQLKNTSLAGLPGSLADDVAKKLGGGGGGGGGGGKGSPQSNLTKDAAQARLFPRAAVTAEVASATRAGIAASAATGGAPMGGMPMGGMGGAHGGQGGQGKEHKSPEFLATTEALEEAIGAPPVVAKPVVEG